jgi:hypothetical protein
MAAQSKMAVKTGHLSLKKKIILKDLRLEMAAQFKMVAKTSFLSESYILMLK